jgi:aspartate/methionine/tyrosine aminotransferase
LLENWEENDPILELNSLSKSHNMAGWRVGVVSGNHELLDHILRFKSNMDSGMFKPIMIAAIKALEQDSDWYEQINNRYRQRRVLAWKLLDLISCNYNKSQSGMFVWADIPEGWESGEKFADWVLERTGVFITPGFIFGSQGEKYIRISLCTELDIWKQVINQVKENIEYESLTNQI